MPKLAPDPALTPQGFVFAPADGRRLPCPGRGRVEYYEPASGLRLRVTSNGARSWLVSYWSPIAKAQRRLKLGDPAKLDLSKARRAARSALTAVAEGRDPFLERRDVRTRELEERARRAEERARRAEERNRRALTFGDVCRKYVEWRRTTAGGRHKRPASPRTLVAWGSMLERHIRPEVGSLAVEDIRTDDFVRVLDHAVKHGGPTMGPFTRELLAAVWRWMETRTKILGVKLPAESPLRELPQDIGTGVKRRTRVLSPAEVWKFWRATAAEGLIGLSLRLMLLTAARVREATELPHAELDLAAKRWSLPASRAKGGRDDVIQLSAQAVTVINAARSLHDGPLVFDAPSSANLARAMARIRIAMGGEHWEARDLRRTAATLCARLGADPFVVALVLRHAKPDERMPDVTGVYLKWQYEERVSAILGRLGKWVADTVAREDEPGGLAVQR